MFYIVEMPTIRNQLLLADKVYAVGLCKKFEFKQPLTIVHRYLLIIINTITYHDSTRVFILHDILYFLHNAF